MTRRRKTWLFLLIVVLVIQFIQPKKNLSQVVSANDISNTFSIPGHIHQTLTKKCYDCHSNNTRYPWYYNVQPIGWWLAAHVYEGKQHLNFSEFRNYQEDKIEKKLDEIAEVVKAREMPIRAYVLLNPHAAITAEDEQAIHSWIRTLRQP